MKDAHCSLVEGLAASVDSNEVELDAQDPLPRERIESLPTQTKPIMGDVQQIADTVHYVLTRPIELNIEEIVFRPQKALPQQERPFTGRAFPRCGGIPC